MAVETSTGELPLAGAPPESTAWQKDMETDDHNFLNFNTFLTEIWQKHLCVGAQRNKRLVAL